MSINNINPTTIFGSTWVEGRVPVGVNSSRTFNSAGKTGGSETHTLGMSELSSHDHSLNGNTHSWPTTNTGGHIHAKYGWCYTGSGSWHIVGKELVQTEILEV